MTKGTFFRAEQYAALSSFMVGKMQILYKRVGFSGRNGKKKHSLFRVVKISKTVKRGSFSDNIAKMVVFTETRNTLCKVLLSLFCSSIGTQLGSKHPPWVMDVVITKKNQNVHEHVHDEQELLGIIIYKYCKMREKK